MGEMGGEEGLGVAMCVSRFKIMFPWILLAVVRVIKGMTFSGVGLESRKFDHQSQINNRNTKYCR